MLTRLQLKTPSIIVEPNQCVYIPDLYENVIFNNPTDNFIYLKPITPSQTIRWFKMLPDLALTGLLKSFSIDIDEFINDKTVDKYMDIVRDDYFILQLWLLRKHDNIIFEELYTESNDLEPVATSSLAGLSLIQSIFDEKYKKEFKKIDSKFRKSYGDDFIGIETTIWFSCELLILEETFLTNGLLGHIIKISQKDLDKRIKAYDYDGDTSPPNIQPIPTDLTKLDLKNAPRAGYKLIELIAKELSYYDVDFKNDVYLPYTKVKKQTLRAMRRNPNMNHVTIENGVLVTPQRGSGKGRSKKDL